MLLDCKRNRVGNWQLFPIYVNSKESIFVFYFWVEKEITYQEKMSIIKVDFKSPVRGCLERWEELKDVIKKNESSID